MGKRIGKVEVLKGTSGISERPKVVDGIKYRDSHDRIFGKKNTKKDDDTAPKK